MSVFVILALAVAVVALGVAVVATLQLIRVIRRLLVSLEQMSTRLGPLSEELEGELTVLGTELDALEAGRGRGQRGRTSSARGSFTR